MFYGAQEFTFLLESSDRDDALLAMRNPMLGRRIEESRVEDFGSTDEIATLFALHTLPKHPIPRVSSLRIWTVYLLKPIPAFC